MAEELEKLIAHWGRQAQTPAGLPAPGPSCLTFAQARQIAAANTNTEQAAPAGADGDAAIEHMQSCERCRRLVADFREAMDEAASAASHYRAGRIVHVLRPISLAAAGLLIAFGLYTVFNAPPPAPKMLLADARAAVAGRAELDMSPKGGQSLASGQAVELRTDLRDQAWVMVLTLDAAGKIAALPPLSDKGILTAFLPAGDAALGPYRLDDHTGRETFFILAWAKAPENLGGLLEQLRAEHETTKDIAALEAIMQSRGAQVRTIQFDHVPADNIEGKGE